MHFLGFRSQVSSVIIALLAVSLGGCGAATDPSDEARGEVNTGADDIEGDVADDVQSSKDDDAAPGSGTAPGGGAPSLPPTATAPGPVSPPDQEPPIEPGLLEQLVPFQAWPDLSASAVGVLFIGKLSNGVYAFDHARTAGPSDQSAMYRFSADGSSPYVLYFESGGEGFNYLKDWQVPVTDGSGEARFDAAQFSPSDLTRWGVMNPVHLVRLEVNAGKGGSGIHFVGTAGEVLDGTAEYPLNPTAVLESASLEASKLFGASNFKAMLLAARDEALAKLAEPAPGVPATDPAAPMPEVPLAPPPPADDRVPVPAQPYEETLAQVNGFWPNWSNKTSTLRVVFVMREAAQWVELGETTLIETQCPPGAPCVPPAPARHAKLSVFGVETAVVFEFDAQGQLMQTEVFEPRAVPFAGRMDTVRSGF